MPVVKRLLRPQLRRQVPTQFSWIDQRLVRDNWLPRCSHRAWTLYLFLVVVADAQGLSYYGDPAVLRHLSCTPDALQVARQELIAAHLIAYQKPLYQVLSLDPPRTFSAGPKRIGDLLPAFEPKETPQP
jgi:hypothetical protein